MFLASAYSAGILNRGGTAAFALLRGRRGDRKVAATQKLHVAQPSSSRQIRDLEGELGVQLLERTAKHALQKM